MVFGWIEGSCILPVCVALPFLGGLVSYGIGRKNKRARDYFSDGVAAVEFLIFLALFISFGRIGRQDFCWQGFGGFGLQLTLDGFRVLYGLAASFMWLATTVFSREYLASYRSRNRYYLFILFTLGATTGVFLSADLYTTFLFFEIMSFTSYVWVAQEETPGALRAASTYLAVAVLGGLVLLMGLFLLYDALGTLRIDELHAAAEAYLSGSGSFSAGGAAALGGVALADGAAVGGGTAGAGSVGRLWAAGLCMLVGFGAKAGAFPLHIWLPKAHPVAPAPASALLSGILTKAGVFGILIISCQIFRYDGAWGSLILAIGVITMVLGAVLALYSVNIKRTLACSSLSQIGFILVGIGMIGLLGEENTLAVRGTLLHMVNHSLIKLVLFMAAGVIYMNLHKLDLNEIRGFGRNKPLFHLIFLAGALGIGGVPLFNGYVSKTLLHESIVEYRELLAEGALSPLFINAGGMAVIEWIFLISGGLTAAYMTKLYICVFVEKNANAETQREFDSLKGRYMNGISGAALACSAAVITVLGITPYLTMDYLADLGQDFLSYGGEARAVSYFSLGNLKGACISLLIGAFVYLFIVRIYMMGAGADGRKEYRNRFSEKLDLENLLYRPVLLKILPFIGAVISRLGDSLLDGIVMLLRKTIYRDSPLPHELSEGTPVTHAAGALLDHAAYAARRLMALRKEEKPAYERRFEHKLAMLHTAVSEFNSIVARSMSFGLFLFCVGFLATVIYLLLFLDFSH